MDLRQTLHYFTTTFSVRTNYLSDHGLINVISTFSGPSPIATLTGQGAVFVESGGESGIIRKYNANPAAFVINVDNRTTVQGNISNSNISSHSSNVNQQIQLAPNIAALLTAMVEKLNADNSISKDALSDALRDIETLKIQISKSGRNRNIIELIFSNLANISSIGSFVTQLSQLLPK
jgi:hypothetical protein